MLGTVERWMAMAADKLAGDPQRVFVCPGNDDQFEVDEILGAATRVELAEGRVVEVDGYQMASTGWSNVTPVEHLPRGARGCPARADPGRHVEAHQPARAGDPEPALPAVRLGARRRARPERGPDPEARRPCSRARRLEGRPHRDRGDGPALSLHGHIHEARGHARIGDTLCINPGSAYEQGELLGALIDLSGKKVKKFVLTSG